MGMFPRGVQSGTDTWYFQFAMNILTPLVLIRDRVHPAGTGEEGTGVRKTGCCIKHAAPCFFVSGQRTKETICRRQMVLKGNAAEAANPPPASRLVPRPCKGRIVSTRRANALVLTKERWAPARAYIRPLQGRGGPLRLRNGGGLASNGCVYHQRNPLAAGFLPFFIHPHPRD